MRLKQIQAQTALHRLKKKFPYGWDLNVYIMIMNRRGDYHGGEVRQK